jgi:hypothetical protein
MKAVLGYPEQQATLATGGNVGGTFDLPKAKAKVKVVHAVHGSELTPPTTGTPDQFKAELAKRKVKSELVIMKPGETRGF